MVVLSVALLGLALWGCTAGGASAPITGRGAVSSETAQATTSTHPKVRAEQNGAIAVALSTGPRSIDPRTGERLGIASGLRNLGAGEVRDWDWSPDGTSLVYVLNCILTCGDFPHGVFIRDVATGQTRHLTAVPDTTTAVAWAPDGTKIAYVDRGQIHVMDPNGSRTGAVVSTARHVADSVSWNPTSGLIAFADSPRGKGPDNVYVSGLDGSAPRLIAPGAEPAWSPDGAEIAFLRGCAVWVKTMGAFPTTTPIARLGSPDIRALDPTLVHRPCSYGLPAQSSQPEWSPDGRLLAVTLPRYGILVVRLNPSCGANSCRFHPTQRVLAPGLPGRVAGNGFSKPAWQPVPVGQP